MLSITMLSSRATLGVLVCLILETFQVVGQALVYQTTDGSGSGNANDGVSSVPFLDQTGFNITRKHREYTVLTSYVFDGCNPDRKKILNQAVLDATDLAAYGIDWIHGGDINEFPFINFRTEAAIDYWGPWSESQEFKDVIFGTIYNAMYAYPGWGVGDWWKNRYVTLSCQDYKQVCRFGAVHAYNYYRDDPRTPAKGKYPAISFCSIYFSDPDLPSLSDAIGAIKANRNNEKENVLNIRSKGSLMLHEWLHMSWGVAKVYAGKGQCLDVQVNFGPRNRQPEVVVAYEPGIVKNLARRAPDMASYTNDNYVYFCAARYMEKTFGKYPQYPVAWNTFKSVDDNRAAETLQPGNPAWNPSVLLIDKDLANNVSVRTANASNLPISDYPAWYQPILTAAVNNASKTFTLPSITTPDAALNPEPTAGADPATSDPRRRSSNKPSLVSSSIEKTPPIATITVKKPPADDPAISLFCPANAGYGTDYGACVEECKDKGGNCDSTPIFAGGHAIVLWACSCK